MRRLFWLVLMLSVPALAQLPQGFYPWWNGPVARDLKLTDQQQKDIRRTIREYRNRLIDARAAVNKAEGDLQDIFNDDPVDTKRGTDAIERLIAARSELTRTLSQMSLKLRTLITAEQWQELQRRRPRNNPSGTPTEAPQPAPAQARPQSNRK